MLRWLEVVAVTLASSFLIVPLASVHAQDCTPASQTKEYQCEDAWCRTFVSPPQWSGDRKNFSGWYCLEATVPEAPDSKFAHLVFNLVGDRKCITSDDSPNTAESPFTHKIAKWAPPEQAGWAECFIEQYSGNVYRARFRMQGHDEDFPVQVDAVKVGLADGGSVEVKISQAPGKRQSAGVLTVKYRK